MSPAHQRPDLIGIALSAIIGGAIGAGLVLSIGMGWLS